MSCIAGVLRRDGAPADPRWVQAMLARMHGRAPDGDEVACDGPLALGHAWLRVDGAARSAAHPIRADGALWITADARIDGRAELLQALRSAGHAMDGDAPHAALIARAWHAWGPRMLERLIGDFAFALWDPRDRTLLCARDHFGVRPLHYVETPELFAFASDLEALRALPQLSDALDDTSVADFLIFGTCLDPVRTIWRDARCLPPAHLLRVDETRATASTRYWDMPQPEPVRLRGQGEYVEAFMQVFTQAVTDRLPESPVATHLSGGMDSTAIAAIATGQARRSGHAITAYHVSCHELLPEDEERHYTEMVAAHLSLPLVCDELGRHALFARCNDPALATSTPFAYPHLAHHDDLVRQVLSGRARVLLTGQGGDAVLTPSATYYGDLLRAGRWSGLAREMLHHLRHTGSPAGMGLRSTLLRRTPEPVWMPPRPDWIEPAFARRVDFEDRWNHAWKSYQGNIDARHQLRQTWVSRSLGTAEVLNLPMVARHPFHDVRLVALLLGLPNFMLVGKHVLREAMRGGLPEPVRIRPKTSLVVDPVRKLAADGKLAHEAQASPAGVGHQYVLWQRHAEALRQFSIGQGSDSTWNNLLVLAPIALRSWLAQQQEGLAT